GQLIEDDDAAGSRHDAMGTGHGVAGHPAELAGDERLLDRVAELAEVAAGEEIEGAGVLTRLVEGEVALEPRPAVGAVDVAVPGAVAGKDRADARFEEDAILAEEVLDHVVQPGMVQQLVEALVFLEEWHDLASVAARDLGEGSRLDGVEIAVGGQTLERL